MKLHNLFLFQLLVVVAMAQPSIHFDVPQSIGQEWGEGVVQDLPFDSFPSPLAGENLTWDFTFIGSMDNGFGVPFSQAMMGDFLLTSFKGIEGLPLDGGGTVQDSFPNAVGVLFQGNDPTDYEQVFIMGQNDDGVVILGELQDYGTGPYEMDDQDSFLLYPTGLNYGGLKEQVRLSWGTGSSTIDSLVYTDSFTFIGYGTAKMYDGDVEDVALYQQRTKQHFWSHSLASGAIVYESYQYWTSYLFLQNGNLLPLLIYAFDTKPDWTPSTGDKRIIVYVPFFQVINGTEETRSLPIDLSVSPNPVQGNRVVVSYCLEKPVPAHLELFAATGEKLMDRVIAVGEVVPASM